MQETLPKPLKFSWKHFFIRGRYQSIYLNDTTVHIQALAKRFSAETNHKELRKQFEDKKFWDALREKSGLHPDVETLAREWKDQKAFANLSARDLRKLKENHLDPLEVALLRTANELEEDLKAYQEYGIWRPKWYIQQHQALINKTNEQIKSLFNFKSKLQASILHRCTMHEYIGEDRHMDDFYHYFAKKINQLGLLETPLQPQNEASMTLDDDARLMFHDWLNNTYPKDKENIKKITAPISQKPYKTPVSKKKVDEENKKIAEFCKSIEQKHSLTSTARIAELKKKKKIEEAWSKKVFGGMFKWLSSWFVPEIARKAWKHRWPLFLLTTLSLYVIFAPAFVASMTATYGAFIGSMAANVLFYGAALFPAWVMLGVTVSSIGKSIYNAFSYWKIRELQEGLELLKSNQRFIAANLKPGILDIEHYDIKGLEESALAKMQEIDKMLVKLDNTNLYQNLVLKGSLKSTWQQTKQQLQAQKKSIRSDLKAFALHISQRVKRGASSLKVNSAKSGMTAKMTSGQLKALYSFVQNYGDEKAKANFEKNTNVVSLLLEAVKNKELIAINNIAAICDEPWGGYKTLKPTFNGWRTLIEGYELNDSKREAANKLLSLLEGKNTLTKQEFGEVVLKLASEGQGAQFASVVQKCLFLTLDRQPANNAALLSPEQQELIKDWHAEYHSEIKQATSFVNKAFNSKSPQRYLAKVTDVQLAKYYRLVDGADFHAAITGGGKPVGNKIREFFEDYNGDTTKALYFVRFAPEEIKSEIVQNMASKRLNWLIEELGISEGKHPPFTEADIEIFQNSRLFEERSLFSFSGLIRNHLKFESRWNEAMESFLEYCTSSGFDDGGLLKEYQDKNARIKKFVNDKPYKYVSLKNHIKEKNKRSGARKEMISKTGVKGVARNAI